MKFHIPKQHRPTKERLDIKLERTLLEKLDRYCQYMESDRDYVIGTVLQVVFRKDKGFAEWQSTHRDAVHHTVRRAVGAVVIDLHLLRTTRQRAVARESPAVPGSGDS